MTTNSTSATIVPTKPMSRAIDQMDAGLDLLVTARMALLTDGGVGQETIEAIGNTIELALKSLRPVREIVNERLL
ncbi:MAG: hypothetical protein J0I13_01485 [Rhizobiales bacterium]|nr:hypothetical protein [Hyphomicrobiales bacterium]